MTSLNPFVNIDSKSPVASDAEDSNEEEGQPDLALFMSDDECEPRRKFRFIDFLNIQNNVEGNCVPLISLILLYYMNLSLSGHLNSTPSLGSQLQLKFYFSFFYFRVFYFKFLSLYSG